jgi:hypothetical protein
LTFVFKRLFRDVVTLSHLHAFTMDDSGVAQPGDRVAGGFGDARRRALATAIRDRAAGLLLCTVREAFTTRAEEDQMGATQVTVPVRKPADPE